MPWKTKQEKKGHSYTLTYYQGSEIQFFPCTDSTTVRIITKTTNGEETIFWVPKAILEDFLRGMIR